jgi:hypothetical protein
MLDGEIAAQERLLEANPAYVKLKALRATREAYRVSAGNHSPSAIAMLPKVNTNAQNGFLSAIVSRTRNTPLSGKSLDAVNAVIRVLRIVGEPVKTASLLEIIRQDGIEFSGSAPQNVLSSLLSRSPDVVSKGGNVGWALKEWDTAGDDLLGGATPPAVDEAPAQGREAGPGGRT